MLMQQQMVQQNSIKQEEFVKLRVKATALRKELTQLQQGQKKAGEDEEKSEDSGSSHDHHKEDGKGDKSISEEEVTLEEIEIDMEDPDAQPEAEMKPLTPQELLKERGWEKLVTDRMKSLIDE